MQTQFLIENLATVAEQTEIWTMAVTAVVAEIVYKIWTHVAFPFLRPNLTVVMMWTFVLKTFVAADVAGTYDPEQTKPRVDK